jgi:hypothetical protein
MKHPDVGPDQLEVDEWVVIFWLNRGISKYCPVYARGTPIMAELFPWAGITSGRA